MTDRIRNFIYALFLPFTAILAYFTWDERWLAGFTAGVAACSLFSNLLDIWEDSQRRKHRKAK